MLGRTLALLLFLAPLSTLAQELYQAGLTPYGMGGAYSAAADDWLSLYYNPAGLALVNKVEFQSFDLELGTNSDVVNGYSNVKSLGSSSSNLASKLNSFVGKHIEANGANFTQLTMPHFAMGLSYQANVNFNMQNMAYPKTVVEYTRDLGISSGAAISFGKQKELRFGMRLAYMHRNGGRSTIGINQILGSKASLLSLFNQSGSAWGGTFGMQYRLPFPGRTEVTTSFVWHDMGKTTFGKFDDPNPPTRIDDNMVTGMAVRFPIGGTRNRRLERRFGPQRSTSAFTLAYDYTELNQRWARRPLLMHSHLGANLDLPILSIQLGLYQTSLSFGTGFDLGIFKISLTTYAEELGAYAGQDRDRRYLLSVGNSFSFGKL